jgi:ribose-phosphate pyrophosphokinase
MAWDGVIAPDKGAVDRAGAVARRLGVALLIAGKVRDSATGKLSGFTAPEGLEAGRYLLVDDICDGGGTFAGLAQAIREAQPDAELHLWVTHGLFTGRWRENLLPHFASITAANTTPHSDRDALPDEVGQEPLRPHVIAALADICAHAVTPA